MSFQSAFERCQLLCARRDEPPRSEYQTGKAHVSAERRFNHGTRVVLDGYSKHDSQLPVAVLKTNFFDMLRIEESFEINDLRINDLRMTGTCLLFRAEQEGGSTISANGVADHCLKGVIDVVAGRANLDGQYQCLTAGVCANEICRPLQRRKRTCAAKTNDGSSLHVLAEAHVRDETAAHIRTDVTRARAHRQEIHILDCSSSRFQAIQNRAATCLHRAGQITFIQLIGGFLAIQGSSKIKVAVFNVAVQENLPNGFALITRSVEALLLSEPDRRVRRSNSKNSWRVHWCPTVSGGESVWRL